MQLGKWKWLLAWVAAELLLLGLIGGYGLLGQAGLAQVNGPAAWGGMFVLLLAERLVPLLIAFEALRLFARYRGVRASSAHKSDAPR